MKMGIKGWILGLVLGMSASLQAARVDTLQVKSVKMNRFIETVVVVPEGAEADKRVPVVYLLHGYGGDARSWLTIQPELKDWADRDGVLIVCPDGENSWYWDSPLQEGSQFETFVSKELVMYVDGHYPTLRDRKARAITGLSMGGHGGLWLSIRHQEVFGAAGSTSGGVDIRPFPKNWEMSRQLGAMQENPARWDGHTVMTQLDKLKNGSLAIIFDCGTEDFFFEVNCKLHEELMKRGIYHDFIARPGMHNLKYWRNSIEYQWLFFTKFFRGYRTVVK